MSSGYTGPVCVDPSCNLMAGVVSDTSRFDDFAEGEWELRG